MHVEEESFEETELAVHILTNNLPVSENRKAEFKTARKSDHALQHLQKLILRGWPNHINNVPQQAGRYVINSVLLMGCFLYYPIQL